MKNSNAVPTEDEPKLFFVTRFIPNFLTLFALCVGLTALRFGIAEKWTQASIFILIAAFVDGADGIVARKLHASTEFGIELDSFADFVSFGISPAIILYLWNLHEAGPFGWIATLTYCVATALRLARFNVKAAKESPDLKIAFFEGVPAPAGAILIMAPLFFAHQFVVEDTGSIPSIYVALWTIFIAGLMVSKLPTYSLKNLNLNLGFKQRIILTISSLIFCTALAFSPWITIIASIFVYLLAIVYGLRKFKKL